MMDRCTAYNAFSVEVLDAHPAQDRKIHDKGGNYLSCCRRLLAIYKRIKGRESARCAECLDLKRAVIEIAASYREAEKKEHDGRKFRVTLESVTPCLFTFLRHLDTPLHNNTSDLKIRDTVVLHRNARYHLSKSEEMEILTLILAVRSERPS